MGGLHCGDPFDGPRPRHCLWHPAWKRNAHIYLHLGSVGRTEMCTADVLCQCCSIWGCWAALLPYLLCVMLHRWRQTPTAWLHTRTSPPTVTAGLGSPAMAPGRSPSPQSGWSRQVRCKKQSPSACGVQHLQGLPQSLYCLPRRCLGVPFTADEPACAGLGVKDMEGGRKFYRWPGQKIAAVNMKPRNISFSLHRCLPPWPVLCCRRYPSTHGLGT